MPPTVGPAGSERDREERVEAVAVADDAALPQPQRTALLDDGVLVGMITGDIEEQPGFEGKTGFLERIIVLPEAKDKLRVMLEMPAAAAGLTMAAGCRCVTLCISHSDPRRARLERWAKRCGYTIYNPDYDAGNRSTWWCPCWRWFLERRWIGNSGYRCRR